MMRKIKVRISLLAKYIRDYSRQVTAKKILREVTPPVFARLAKLAKSVTVSYQGYFGVYSSFKECWEYNQEVLAKSGTFNNRAYALWSLERTKQALAESTWATRLGLSRVKLMTRISLELGGRGSLRILDYGGG